MTTLSPPPARPVAAVRTTRPRTTPRGAGQAAHASDYAELSRRIKDAGLLERRYGPYLLRSVLLLAAFAACVTATFLIGASWWQLAMAVVWGGLFAQFGFLAHDGAHRQVFASGKRNEWFSRVVANMFVGLGYGWWMHKHTKHHGNPNTIGRDLDLDANVVVFTEEDAERRSRGFVGLVLRNQGWLLLPAMTLTGLDLHVKTLRMLLGRGPVPHRGAELALILVRLIGFPVLLVLAAGPVIGLVTLLVQLLAFGFLMGGAFAPNHIGMPQIGHLQKVDYLRRQVLTSRNITGGPAVDFLMGGLNHQIEHHLFPSMPSANLRRARRMIRDYCAELQVPYLERPLVPAMADVIKSVHRIGVRAADPFDCPAAAALRMA